MYIKLSSESITVSAGQQEPFYSTIKCSKQFSVINTTFFLNPLNIDGSTG